jgi:hypothetical protein
MVILPLEKRPSWLGCLYNPCPLLRQSYATDITTREVLSHFLGGSVYYAGYKLAAKDDFCYLFVANDNARIFDDGLSLIREFKARLDQERTIWQRLGEFKFSELIAGMIALAITLAFIALSIYKRELDQDFLAVISLVAGYYFGRNVKDGSRIARPPDEIARRYPSATDIVVMEVVSQFLDGDVYYADFKVGGQEDFCYVFVSDNTVRIFDDGESVLNEFKSQLDARLAFFQRLGEFTLAEIIGAFIALGTTAVFVGLSLADIKLNQGFLSIFSVITGYYFGRNVTK